MNIKKIKKTWDAYLVLKSTRKVSESLGIARRTVQHHLKTYRDLFGEEESKLVIEDSKFTIKDSIQAEQELKKESKKQINVELKNGTIVVFSDTHIVPGKDLSVACKALLKVVDEIKPDVIINNGDLFDFSTISRHDRLGWEKTYSVKDEIEAGNVFLKKIMKASPHSKYFYIDSNHDSRYNKFLVKHAPQFKGLKGFDLKDQLPEEWEHGLSLVVNQNTIFLHEFNSGVHSAYNNVLKSGMSIVTGHTHMMESKPFTDYTGTRYGIQTGTLSTIKNNDFFDYTMGTPLNWVSGFVVLTYVDGELQAPELCVVNNKNKAFFRGKII